MTDRASAWSLTINNPSKDDEECIALVRQKGWRVEGQKEQGKEGTVHYQLYLKTPQVRFSAVKKTFPRAHIEVARNASALRNYVNKEETRISQLPVGQDRYPSLSKFWCLIYDELCDSHEGPAEDVVDWSSKSKQSKLVMFDAAVESLIFKGYYVETLAVNPQTRSCFEKYAEAILKRAYADRQTDRQDDVECVQIPVISSEQEQNANDSEEDSSEHEDGQSESYSTEDEEGTDEDSGSEGSCSEGSWSDD